MMTILTERMKKTSPGLKFLVKDSIPGDPIEAARNDSSRFAIIGTVELFDVSQHAEISTRADEYREYAAAKVRLRVRLIDALASQQVAEEFYSGEIQSGNAENHSWQTIGKLKFDLRDKAFAGSIMGKAMDQAITQATEKLTRYIE
jgi:hypothetical protein